MSPSLAAPRFLFSKYCDEYVCLSVCLYVCLHISETTRPNFEDSALLPVAVTQSSSDIVALRYLCTSGFVDDVIFSHSWPYGESCLHCCKIDQPILCLGVRTPKPLNRFTKKFGVGDYVGDDTPQAKIQNDRPIGVVAVYAGNITLEWFLVFLSYPILSFFVVPNFVRILRLNG